MPRVPGRSAVSAGVPCLEGVRLGVGLGVRVKIRPRLGPERTGRCHCPLFPGEPEPQQDSSRRASALTDGGRGPHGLRHREDSHRDRAPAQQVQELGLCSRRALLGGTLLFLLFARQSAEWQGHAGPYGPDHPQVSSSGVLGGQPTPRASGRSCGGPGRLVTGHWAGGQNRVWVAEPSNSRLVRAGPRCPGPSCGRGPAAWPHRRPSRPAAVCSAP